MTPPNPKHPEQQARKQIDTMLVAAGWAIQDRKDINLAAASGVAVREFYTKGGPADYLLFLGTQLVGVIEAKKAGVTLTSVEAQTRDYAEKVWDRLQVPIRPLPFLYESTGVETWFTNGLDPEPRARRVFAFHRPETCASGSTPSPDAGAWPSRPCEVLRVSQRSDTPRAHLTAYN
jgi:type I restriction enzyme R subunit